MKQGKISAFTLFEIVLALMLAGIVVGMAYTSFRLFSKIYRDYHDKTASGADLQLLRKMFYADINQSSLITLSGSQIMLNGMRDSAGVRYLVYADYLIRQKAPVQDTFSMKSLVLSTYFEGGQVSTGIVDQLVYRFDFEGNPMSISVGKAYTSEDLFNYTDTLWKQ